MASGHAFVGLGSGFCRQADELGDCGAHQIVVPARRQVGCGGRENVAAVEGRGDGRLDHRVLSGDFAGGVEAVAVEGGGQDAVVRRHEVLAFFGFGNNGFAGSADARVDYGQEDGIGGVVRRYTQEETRGFLNGVWRDLMSDVGQADLGSDAVDYRTADRYRVIGGAEVGHEDDGRAG